LRMQYCLLLAVLPGLAAATLHALLPADQPLSADVVHCTRECPLISQDEHERRRREHLLRSRSATTLATEPAAGKPTVVYIHGERESGTNYAEELFKENALNSVHITSPVGFKHTMGPNTELGGEVRPAGNTSCEVIERDANQSGADPLYLVVTRNAIDWAHGFFEHPWHSRYHCSLELDDFVSKSFGPDAGPPGVGARCNAYVAGESNVTWLYWRENHQPDGRHASDLLEARSWWLRSWLETAACTGSSRVKFVQYEELMGTDGWGFEEVFKGWQERLTLSPSFPSDVTAYKGHGTVVDVAALVNRSIYHRLGRGENVSELMSDHALNFILDNLDADLERALGYTYPRSDTTS